jgi:hypothetical protein
MIDGSIGASMPTMRARLVVVPVLVFSLFAAAAPAQTRMLSVHGPGGSNLGVSVTGLGDLNADGFDDFAAGSPYEGVQGTVRVYSGFDGSVLATFAGTGMTAGVPDNFGYSVAGGDVNNDGVLDVIVGAPQYSFTPPLGNGWARVFSGSSGAVLQTVTGVTGGGAFGFAVDAAGDVNGDGFGDVVVGASTYSAVHSATNGAVVFSQIYGGSDVAGVGDVNNDGFAEVVVGSESAGTAKIYFGPNGTSFITLFSTGPFSGFGYSVAGAGDTDGDGVEDVVVGAPYAGGGLAVVFNGQNGNVINSFNGAAANDRFGWCVSGAGDVDGNGLAEVAVGAPYDQTGGIACGSVRLCSVPTGAALFTVYGDSTYDLFGWSIAAAGHVNGDIPADFVVGAYGDVSFSGAAYVISGLPLPLATASSLGGGCGAPGLAPTLALSAPPRLGSTFTIWLTSATPAASGYLVADLATPALTPLGGGCIAFPNLAHMASWIQVPLTTDAAGSWQILVGLSASHVFAGLPVTMQAAVFPTAGPLGLDLTNGLVLVVGY